MMAFEMGARAEVEDSLRIVRDELRTLYDAAADQAIDIDRNLWQNKAETGLLFSLRHCLQDREGD